MTSHFFIDRPIFASVLSIILVVVGLVSLHGLPIAQFPEITPPVVQIETDYPGASAEVIADSVARPIEVQLPGIDNLLYYDSTSTNDGHVVIKLTFEIGTNLDIAQVQVQNKVQTAMPKLPEEVRRTGVTVKKQSTDMLMVLSVYSPDATFDELFVSNFVKINIKDELFRIPGVGDVFILGEREYGMRLVTTAPSVVYEVLLRDGSLQQVSNPAKLPDPSQIEEIREPVIATTIFVPQEYVGPVMTLCTEKRGTQTNLHYSSRHVVLSYDLPLNEVVLDFFDRLKSLTRGFGSMDYDFKAYRPADVIRLDVLTSREA